MNSGRKKLTTEEFILKAKIIHKGKFDYSKTVYNGYKNSVLIVCPIHGEFEVNARNHLSGSDCKKCYCKNIYFLSKNFKFKNQLYRKFSSNRGIGRLTQEDAIKKMKNKHGEKFDYSLVKYINYNEKIRIKCIKHNLIFETSFSNHVRKNSKYGGCPECIKTSTMKTKNIDIKAFIVKLKEKFGNKYDYSKVKNINNIYLDKIIVICRKHGKFNPIAYNHLHGSNCPQCNKEKKKTYGSSISIKPEFRLNPF